MLSEMRNYQQKNDAQFKAIIDKLGCEQLQVEDGEFTVEAEDKSDIEVKNVNVKEPQQLEGLRKGDKNRTVEEDKRLKEQVVNQTQYDDLQDFEDLHLFKTDEK